MKALYNLSKWSWFVMFVLYVVASLDMIRVNNAPASGVFAFGLVFGALIQILVGILHIISWFYAYSQYGRLRMTERIMLHIYSVLTVFFFIAWVAFVQSDRFLNEDENLVAFVLITPTCIGGYFIWVLYRVKNTIDLTMVKNESNRELLDG